MKFNSINCIALSLSQIKNIKSISLNLENNGKLFVNEDILAFSSSIN